jgi:hypothetical protein
MVSNVSCGSTTLIKPEKLEFESLPEFVREPRTLSNNSYVAKAAYIDDDEEQELPKSAELETLWPGVNQDFLHVPKRGAGFYLTTGFVAGVVVTLVGVCSFSVVSRMSSTPPVAHKVIVSEGKAAVGVKSAVASENATAHTGTVLTRMPVANSAELVVPANPTYVVGTGDTLAGIALKNYKRVSPRLIDAICKANGMKNANVLALGQTVTLPDYRPQYNNASSIQTNNKTIAAGGNSVQQ